MTLFETQVRDVWVLPRDIKVCAYHAQQAEIGGQSNIREKNGRKENMAIDQLVGQLGEYALSMYLTGSPIEYQRQRTIANTFPSLGDNGQDIFGLNIDVKTSAMRNRPSPLDYTLAVRPKEVEPEWCYVLALVQPNGTIGIVPTMAVRVRLVGWISTEELPKAVEKHGTFKGAYTVVAQYLHPLPNLEWFWRK